ncbi:hypothetical protein N0V91_008624 [Didymella pomorum]|uniref:Uncharacterized protein n=1 Tax=Didymella pomorum TaxID=749634 RepID=A0A9W8Z6V7_9PLEO|nr:hypothetical protein N0V91_008624 [Didymella pomorum]
MEARYPHVWQKVDYYDGQLASAITQYRWAVALLARVYANKIAQLREITALPAVAAASPI